MSAPRDPLAAGYAACETETARAARNFALGIRLLPPDRRRALSAVYWFSRRADDAADADADAAQRASRLAAVRSELDRALAGGGHTGPGAGDPDSPAGAGDPRWAAVADAARRYDVPAHLFHELLDGVARDLEPARFPDWPALRAYCHGVAGVVGLIALRVFGGPPEAEGDAADLGYALQLTNILRDLREDAARGRWYLPLDETTRFGVDPGGVAEGRAGPGYEALMALEVERARGLYAAAPRLVRSLPRASRACPAALAGVYRGILERIAERPRAALAGEVTLPRALLLARGLLPAARAVAVP